MKPGDIEIHQEAGCQISQSELGQKLCFVYIEEGLNRLDFHDEATVNQKINSIPPSKIPTFVRDR